MSKKKEEKAAESRRAATNGQPAANAEAPRQKLNRQLYETELARLQLELVKLQEWIRHKELKVVIIFEGRDAGGKGGVIKRITDRLNPRICRIVALGVPTERRLRPGNHSLLIAGYGQEDIHPVML